MSQAQNHLNHTTWECKYHVVFTQKYREGALFGQIRRHLGTIFHDLARRKECKIEEGKLMPDHVHILISIPPKYSVAEVIGFLKGKSSIWIAQNVERKVRNFLATSSGPEDTSSRRSVVTRRRSGPTSRTRKSRISSWISCN